MRYCFELAKDTGCRVQLHTESATEDDSRKSAGISRMWDCGWESCKTLLSPDGEICEKTWDFPMCCWGNSIRPPFWSTRFMMGNGLHHDLKRPVSVLGHKTVPRRQTTDREWVRCILEIHKDNTEKYMVWRSIFRSLLRNIKWPLILPWIRDFKNPCKQFCHGRINCILALSPGYNSGFWVRFDLNIPASFFLSNV